ncbi:hypothetical protein ABK040_003836, partial [Willaertia magna]
MFDCEDLAEHQKNLEVYENFSYFRPSGFVNGSFSEGTLTIETANIKARYKSNLSFKINRILNKLIKNFIVDLVTQKSNPNKGSGEKISSTTEQLKEILHEIENEEEFDSYRTICLVLENLDVINNIKELDALSDDFLLSQCKSLTILLSLEKLPRTKENFKLLIKHSDFLINESLNHQYLTFISSVWYSFFINSYNEFSEETTIELLRESFLIANYANIVDPIGSERILILIGSELVNYLLKYDKKTGDYNLLLEFVLRRISTSNTGRMNKDFAQTYCNVLLYNVNNGYRPPITINSVEFTKDLKRAQLDKKIMNFLEEDLEKFKKEGDVRHLYKAIHTVYSDSSKTFNSKAHKLALICSLDFKCDFMDDWERMIALFNSIHNFHVIFKNNHSDTEFIRVNSWINNNCSSNVLNIDAYVYVVETLVDLLKQDKPSNKKETRPSMTIPSLRFIKKLDLVFPDILLLLSLDNLQFILGKLKKMKGKEDFLYQSLDAFNQRQLDVLSDMVAICDRLLRSDNI